MVDGKLNLGGTEMILAIMQAATSAPPPAPPLLTHITQAISAIGALGTAAFGLVDATKVFNGGVNHIGFKGIRARMTELVPDASTNALGLGDVLETLRGNWFNGTDLASQKAIAKSLIKLNFNSTNVPLMAQATKVEATVLEEVANSIENGTALTPEQSNVYARFDLILTALLDETYQRADQKYRNGTRAWAVVFSILLAIAGASILDNGFPWNTPGMVHLWEAVLIGLLATPLAPIAKDLSTALATAVNAMQAVKK